VFTNIEDQHALVNYIDDWRYQSEVLIHRESEDTHHWLLAWNEKLKTAVYILVELTLATTEGKKNLPPQCHSLFFLSRKHKYTEVFLFGKTYELQGYFLRCKTSKEVDKSWCPQGCFLKCRQAQLCLYIQGVRFQFKQECVERCESWRIKIGESWETVRAFWREIHGVETRGKHMRGGSEETLGFTKWGDPYEIKG